MDPYFLCLYLKLILCYRFGHCHIKGALGPFLDEWI
jgi:hypothetical protein